MVMLLECPFCGADAVLDGDGTMMGYHVFCKGCMIHTIRSSAPIVVSLWNRRDTK